MILLLLSIGLFVMFFVMHTEFQVFYTLNFYRVPNFHVTNLDFCFLLPTSNYSSELSESVNIRRIFYCFNEHMHINETD